MPKIVDEQMREATRRRIMHEAASEFARLGFDQANINVIAEQAGIGKGTIYLYFESKRDLFLSMLRSIAQEQLAVIRVALAAEGTIRQRLERLFRAFCPPCGGTERQLQCIYERPVRRQPRLPIGGHQAVARLCGRDCLDAGAEPGPWGDPLPQRRGHRPDGALAHRVVRAFGQGAWTIRTRHCSAGRTYC